MFSKLMSAILVSIVALHGVDIVGSVEGADLATGNYTITSTGLTLQNVGAVEDYTPLVVGLPPVKTWDKETYIWYIEKAANSTNNYTLSLNGAYAASDGVLIYVDRDIAAVDAQVWVISDTSESNGTDTYNITSKDGGEVWSTAIETKPDFALPVYLFPNTTHEQGFTNVWKFSTV